MSLAEEKKADTTPEDEDNTPDKQEEVRKKDDITESTTSNSSTEELPQMPVDQQPAEPASEDKEPQEQDKEPPTNGDSSNQPDNADTADAEEPKTKETTTDTPADTPTEVTPDPTDNATTNATSEEGGDNPQTKEETAESEPTAATNVDSTAAGTVGLHQNGLKHAFAPGDHVIRWEMLPIVWPIQIHGIVLETGRDYVSICDFGLTAEPRHDLKESEAEKKEEEAAAAAAAKEKENGPINTNARLLAAWDRVKPPDNTKKERITVHIITTQDELKAWKKVNYGQGLFGTGDEETYGSDPSTPTDPNAPGGDENLPANPRPRHIIKAKVGQWWQGVKQRRQERQQQNQQQSQQQQPSTTNANFNDDSTEMTTATEADAATFAGNASMSHLGSTTEPLVDGEGDDNNDKPSLKTSKSDPSLSASGHGASNNNNTPTTPQQQNAQPKSPPPQRRRLFARLQRHRSKSRSQSPTSRKNGNGSNENVLPKSDPPKLVLARTQFLLAHGEKVLPPYHPFKANSECIAVFCKTGRWSTLQASVFLHSTAIGNAKSSMAMTLGVAASVPLLAPAIAGIGIVAVGAPYVILNQSREFWQQETVRLNELVWAQADPEVFVECIEQWSKIPEYYQKKKKAAEEAEKKAAAAAAKEGDAAKEEEASENGDNGNKAENQTPNDNNSKAATAPSSPMKSSITSSPTKKTRPTERFVSV